MNKIIGTVICGLALALPLHAQKKGKVQEVHTADYYMERYLFDDAEEVIQKEITKLKRKRKSTEKEEETLQQIERLRSMTKATEQVTFIDSFVVDKSDFLQRIKLSPESGSISTYAEFFKQSGVEDGTVYMSELGNKICFSQPDKDGFLRLYTANRVGNAWDTPHLLSELEGDDMQNYPFMLSDGVTLYYAAQGDESIGGYDIFVTRYNSDDKEFLYPENIGMPFNSPANDYMFAIDEFNKLGWFVSDRNQPEDKVCIYVFIPNEVRKVYSAEEMPDEQLGRLARICSIADTWGDKAAVNAARTRLSNALTAIQATEKKTDINLVINDGITYTLFEDFKSAEARQMAMEWKKAGEQLAQKKEQLEALRERYATKTDKKDKDAEWNRLKEQILAAEAQYEAAETAWRKQEKNIRNTENRALQAGNNNP